MAQTPTCDVDKKEKKTDSDETMSPHTGADAIPCVLATCAVYGIRVKGTRESRYVRGGQRMRR